MIIIPDIHGRSFWKEVIKEHENEEIIFLGDYLDPYPYEDEFKELNEEEIFKKEIENFKKIIELKKSHPNNIVLLLGNHDLHYTSIDKCSRYNYLHSGEIFNIFTKNRELFQMAYEKNINGKRFIFSHAGISINWLNYHNLSLKGWTEENIVNWINNDYLTHNGQFFNALNDISHYRGGFNQYGSMVWADCREYIKNENFSENPEKESNGLIGDYQIFGHTQLNENPLIWEDFANLDCRRAFLLNDNGEIAELNGTIIEKTKNTEE